MVALVTAANLSERESAELNLAIEHQQFFRFVKIWVDNGDGGEGFMLWVTDT